MGHMADVAKWEAKAGTPRGGGSSRNYNYQPEKKGCWGSFLVILKWLFIIFVVIIILALIFGD